MGLIKRSVLAGVFPDRSEAHSGLEREIQEAGDVLASHAYWVMGLDIGPAIKRAAAFLAEEVQPMLRGTEQERAEVREFLAEIKAEVLADRGRQAQAEEGLSGPVADLDLGGLPV